MDLCAELTLQVLRFVQQPLEPPCSPRQWVFVPEGMSVGWVEARQLLTDAPKPIIIGPLTEPGMIGTWGFRALREKNLAQAEYNLNNQQQWLEAAVDHFKWSEDAQMLFETAADSLMLPLSELRRWLKEYAVLAGWTMGEGPDAERPGRLLIRHPGGGWSPGMVCGHRGVS